MPDYSFDLLRIFFGELPAVFYLEVVLRTTVLYLYALAMLRLLGKRSASELTALDVIVIVALGSSVGDPMFYQDVPILHGMLVITLVIGMQRLVLYLANRHSRIQSAVEGTASRVISEGQIDLEGIRSSLVSPREVFARAREAGHANLAAIRSMYIETDGSASVFAYPSGQAAGGLPIEPPWEVESPDFIHSPDDIDRDLRVACGYCGLGIDLPAQTNPPPCPRCHHRRWVRAA